MLVAVPVSLLGQNPGTQATPAQTTPAEGSSPTQSTAPPIAPGASAQGQTGAAILHAQGGVWVNGYEAADSSAVFPGDELQTKPASSASLTLDGASVLIQPESVGKLQTNLLELDHGSVFVGTSKGFRVQVNCLMVTPVHNEWTQYEVTNVNGTVQVDARKDDVYVDRQSDHKKPGAATEAESSRRSVVHEGEQKSFDVSEICGAPPLTRAGSIISPKWVAAGGAGAAGILICVLLCGGSHKPISPSSAAAEVSQ